MITLAAAFGLWGINDIFRGGNYDNDVAVVGDAKVTTVEYDRELRAAMRNQGQRMGDPNLTMEQARNLGITRTVLDRVINRTALDTEVKKLGLSVGNDTVVAAIRQLPQFQSEGGTFSRALLQETLKQNGMNEQMFEEGIREDMARTQLIGSAIDWMDIPPTMARLLFAYLNQLRTAEYIVFTPDMAGPVRAPGDAEIDAYYKANGTRFSTPEYREIEYVEISTDKFSGKVEVAEADIKKEYDTHKETYVKPEEREIQQINFPSKQTADAAHQKITTGTSFADIAHGMGLKDNELNLGTFPKSGLDPRLADAAFAVPEGGATAPVQGPFGWVIMRVTKITPGVDKKYEDVRDTIRAQMAKGQAMGKAIEAANGFEDARAGGATMADAAAKVELDAVHVAAVDKNGLAPDGAKVNLPADPKFLQQVFVAEAGEEGDIFQTDDEHSFAIKVVGVRPPAPRPLDQVRDQVVKEWSEAERARQLAAHVKSLAEEARRNGNLNAVAAATGHQPVTSQPMRRDAGNEIFSQPVLAQLFAAPPGSVVYGPLGKGAGYVIARAAGVNNLDPQKDPGAYENNRRQLGQQLAGDLIQSMALSARNNAGTTINEQAYNRVVGGSQ